MIDLLRKQLDQQHEKIRLLTIDRPSQGWIKSIREALGMTLYQLGEKIGTTSEAVRVIENSEKSYTISLKTLQKVANGLDCRLFYVLIPRQPLQEKVEAQILKKATSIVQAVSYSMELEDQKTDSEEIKRQVQKVMEDIKRRKNISLIWDEESS